MITIDQATVDTVFVYFQYYYVVTKIHFNSITAKRIFDGAVINLNTEKLLKASFVKDIETHNYVAMDRCGTPFLFPGKPTRDKYGDWKYEIACEGTDINFALIISRALMKQLTGRILTNADEPVEV